jgi:hypothetical protein
MTQTPHARFQQWLDTAHQFDRRAPENVTCPCCGSTSLSVKDVEYGFGHDKGVQRYITCGCCGAFTGVNIRRAGEDLQNQTAGETLLPVRTGRA